MQIFIQSIAKRRILVFSLLIILLALGWKLPFTQEMNLPCTLKPSASWYIALNGSDQLVTGWESSFLQTGGNRVLLQFERPDYVEFQILPHLKDGSRIQIGDTIAVISSRENIGKLNILRAELSKAEAELASLQAGAREEDIEVARQDILRAQAALETFTFELDRIKSLYESKLIPLSELQAAEGNYRILESDLKRAQSNLVALQAPAKTEDIEVAHLEINRLIEAVSSLQGSLGKNALILSPIMGQLRIDNDIQYIVRVEKTDTLVVIIPAPESALLTIEENSEFCFVLTADRSQYFQSRVLKSSVFDFGLGETLCIIGVLPNPTGEIMPGMSGRAKIPLGKQTLFQGIGTKIRFSL